MDLEAGFFAGFCTAFLLGAFLPFEEADDFFAFFLDFEAAGLRVLLDDLTREDLELDFDLLTRVR